MEFVGDYTEETQNLFKFIKNNLSIEKNLAVKRKLIFNIFNQILAGLKYIHSLGYVHRDLKPDNILLDTLVSPIVVKIADFGFAKMILDSVDEFGFLINDKKPSCKLAKSLY